ncbi:response regulator [Fusobacteria bacterium ZRK30]|nr:response regulator [Fusobacteria bacterium ZRK30]
MTIGMIAITAVAAAAPRLLDNCSNKSFYSDGLKIYQIINNLVNNAIKYTEAGFVFFEIQNKDKYLFIDVFDSGMGISTENLKIIFEPFEQVDNQKNGLGLGLNIIKNYIESLKGKLEVISHLEKGSHFKVKIPIFQTSNLNLMENLEKVWLKNLEGERRKITLKAIIRLPKKIKALKEAVDNKDILNAKKINHMILGVSGNFKFDEIYQLSKKIAENLNFDLGNTELELNSMKQIINSIDYRQIFGSLIESEGRKYRILLADDTAENRELVREMLKIKCIELKSVDNGKKVLEILEKEYFDLILLDIQMPVLNGIEVLKAMKEKNKDIPVISLTAEAIKGCRKKHLSLGFKEYISKPIDEVEFYNKIEEILHYEDFSC